MGSVFKGANYGLGLEHQWFDGRRKRAKKR